jgi:hypothetical protein
LLHDAAGLETNVALVGPSRKTLRVPARCIMPPCFPAASQLLGMKGADVETDIWKIRVQLMKPVTWIPLIWGGLPAAGPQPRRLSTSSDTAAAHQRRHPGPVAHATSSSIQS